jgi:hypothetical protein
MNKGFQIEHLTGRCLGDISFDALELLRIHGHSIP